MSRFLTFVLILFFSVIPTTTDASFNIDTLLHPNRETVDPAKADSLIKEMNQNLEKQLNSVPHNTPPGIEPLDNLNPYHEFMVPYDSTQHLNPKLSLLIVVCFIIFIFYVGYRVRRSIKNDNNIDDKE